MTKKRESYQYWKGVGVGLLVLGFIFMIPIIASIFYFNWKYMAFFYWSTNMIIGFIALIIARKEQSSGELAK